MVAVRFIFYKHGFVKLMSYVSFLSVHLVTIVHSFCLKCFHSVIVSSTPMKTREEAKKFSLCSFFPYIIPHTNTHTADSHKTKHKKYGHRSRIVKFLMPFMHRKNVFSSICSIFFHTYSKRMNVYCRFGSIFFTLFYCNFFLHSTPIFSEFYGVDSTIHHTENTSFHSHLPSIYISACPFSAFHIHTIHSFLRTKKREQ